MKQIAIIIVNYRTADLTLDCLASLAADEWVRQNACICVVDNASNDGSTERLSTAISRSGWSDWVSLLAAGENRGFAAGNNLAIQQILHNPMQPAPEYMLLLNPDTVVRAGGVETLASFMDKNRRVGIAGSRLEDPDGASQVSAFRFHNILGEFECGVRTGLLSRLLKSWCIAPTAGNIPHATDWVAGAAMMIRSELFRRIGLMDQKYFMYYEEVDFCRRARAAGWECWYVPDARIVHLVGQASGVTDKTRKSKAFPTYWFESRLRYLKKNHGRAYAVLAEGAFLLGLLLWHAGHLFARKPSGEAPNRVRGGLKWIIIPAICGHA